MGIFCESQSESMSLQKHCNFLQKHIKTLDIILIRIGIRYVIEMTIMYYKIKNLISTDLYNY